MRRWLSSVLIAGLLSTGCYKATFIENPSSVLGEEHEEWSDFFLFGLVGSEEFRVEDFCPSGKVAQVRTGGNFLTGLVSVLTIFIYTPRKVYVWCDGGAGAQAGGADLTVLADADGKPMSVQRSDGAVAELTQQADGRVRARFERRAR